LIVLKSPTFRPAHFRPDTGNAPPSMVESAGSSIDPRSLREREGPMRRKQLLGVTAVLTAAALIGGATALYSSPLGGKTMKLKLKLPESDAVVKVDDKEVKGEGTERTITVTTAKDKDYVNIVAYWEPNNYTYIWRPRKVKYKEGEIVVDFLKQT